MINQKIHQQLLSGSVVLIAVAVVSLLYLSPFTYQQFNQICVDYNYDGCMRFYQEQTSYFNWVVRISLGLAALMLVGWLLTRSSHNQTDKKALQKIKKNKGR